MWLRDSEKVKKVLDFSPPKLAKELRSFIGLTSYFSDKVESMQLELAPLRAIEEEFRSTKILRWTDEGLAQFALIKQMINDHQKIFFHDIEHGTVFADALDYGIGGYICQRDTQGREYPIGFLSEVLDSTQRRWTTIEKECYAIVRTFEKFVYLLRDIPFVLMTDHENLTYLNVPKSSKVLHWKLAIQEYDFNISHVAGTTNVVADCFSRLLSDEEMDGLLDIPKICVMTGDDLIPPDKYELIRAVHNALVGHRGIERTVQYLRVQGHEWAHMRNHVATFLRNCPTCQKMSTKQADNNPALFTTSARIPHELINIDTLEVGQEDNEGYQHILVVIDSFTRWVELYPLKTLTAEEAITAIIHYFCTYGTPVSIKTDNGKQFINDLMKAVNSYFQIGGHTTIIPHSHEENAIVERANKEVLRHLRAYVFDNRISSRWSKAVPFVKRIINTTTHSITGFTPAELMFGPAATLDRYIIDHNPNLTELSGHVPESVAEQHRLHKAILERARLLQQEADAAHLQETRGTPVQYDVGSYVLLEYPVSMAGKRPPRKLMTRKRGPLKVIEVNGSDYALQDCITKEIEHVHLSRILPFYYDPTQVDPEEIAYRDKGEFEVESIVDHNGTLDQPKSAWDFKVRWKGYSSEEDLWLPWKELRNNPKLHKYLYDHGYEKLIPKEHRRLVY